MLGLAMGSLAEVGGSCSQGDGPDLFVDAQQEDIVSTTSSDPKPLSNTSWHTHSSQSNSSGRSSRGCTPPPASSNWQSSTPTPDGVPKKHFLELSKLDCCQSESGLSTIPFKKSSSAKSISKLSTHPSTSSLTSYGSEKRKKKSWMQNAINPTYRSRCKDLRKNFPGLPSDETLIVDYSCALQKEILVHGRLYVTTNFLCFQANIFRWETAVTIRWREVTAMTKEKTALVIPNAVQICTGSEKLFFTSFAARDKTHMMLFRTLQLHRQRSGPGYSLCMGNILTGNWWGVNK